MMTNKNTLSTKFIAIGHRLWRWLTMLPTRFWRLGYHFYRGITFQMSRKEYWKDEAPHSSRASVILLWILEFFVLLLEIIGVGELYETITDFAKFNTRPMHDWEIQLAQSIFGNSIDYQPVRIDERAWLGPKQYHFFYVSFHLINSWEQMPNHILIHELMHIWQYQRIGAIYTVRALIAQRTRMGYDYGGIRGIQEKIANGQSLLDFNLEQQADVVADCFLLQQGYAPRWGKGNLEDLIIYQQFLRVLQQDLRGKIV
ncbi:MAG: hypothetical protein AAGJ18_12975 [Bacteroidota bacterium]